MNRYVDTKWYVNGMEHFNKVVEETHRRERISEQTCAIIT